MMEVEEISVVLEQFPIPRHALLPFFFFFFFLSLISIKPNSKARILFLNSGNHTLHPTMAHSGFYSFIKVF
jgi:hypothetical protein